MLYTKKGFLEYAATRRYLSRSARDLTPTGVVFEKRYSSSRENASCLSDEPNPVVALRIVVLVESEVVALQLALPESFCGQLRADKRRVSFRPEPVEGPPVADKVARGL